MMLVVPHMADAAAAPPATSAPVRISRPAAARHPLRRFAVRMTPGTWMVADWLIIGLAAGLVWLGLEHFFAYQWLSSAWLVIGTFCAATTIAGLVFGLYERDTLLSRSRILVRGTLTMALGTTLALAVLALLFYAAASRWIGLGAGIAFAGLAIPARLLAHEQISSSPVRLLCVGAGESLQRLIGLLERCHRRHYEILGHVRAPLGPARLVAGTTGFGPRFRSEAELHFHDVCRCMGTLDEIAALLGEHAVDEVVFASELSSEGPVGQAVATCLEARCRVTDPATFVEKLLGEVPVEHINADWFLRADVQQRGHYETISRILDLLAATIGLALTLPLWPLVALLIRLDSPGPVLYRQVRVGQHGRCFRMCKFRTMRADAEKDGARWAAANDSRVTRIGRFLRKTRLDELPQLLNILRGDMALVGPRPERPEFVHRLEQVLPHYRLRHLVRPGLSGWAQIHYGYGASVTDAHRKLCYDLYYLKHRSLELDCAILIRTVGTFLLGAR